LRHAREAVHRRESACRGGRGWSDVAGPRVVSCAGLWSHARAAEGGAGRGDEGPAVIGKSAWGKVM